MDLSPAATRELERPPGLASRSGACCALQRRDEPAVRLREGVRTRSAAERARIPSHLLAAPGPAVSDHRARRPAPQPGLLRLGEDSGDVGAAALSGIAKRPAGAP